MVAPRQPRYESLDMWRGIACLLVLVNHAVVYQLPAGETAQGIEHLYAAAGAVATRLWIGVPIFFVISGYCISATVDNHRRKNLPVGTYFLRRFRRIFPPYWVTLLLMAAAVGALDLLFQGGITRSSALLRPWWYSPAQWLGSLTLTETWRTHLTGGQKGLVLGPAWTLCYEEQFYAVCGLLLIAAPRRFFSTALVLTLGVAGIVLFAHWTGTTASIEGFFFDGGWIQFALGILLYYALNYATPAGHRVAALIFTLVAVLSLRPALLDLEKNVFQEFFTAGSFALMALWLRPFDRTLNTAPWLQPLRLCGLMCYSLYLVHMPVINILRGVLESLGLGTLALPTFVSLPLFGIPALVVAWVFHVHVERRFMNSTVVRAEPRSAALATAAS